MGKKSAPRRFGDNEAMAFAKAIRISPQKLNLVAKLIRGKKVAEALAELTFSRRRVAAEVHQLLQSAIANAENNHQLDVDRLYISEATVGRSFSLRRFRARARGRMGSISKPFSNLTLVVRENEEAS
ncbi:MAG: 50S ribosomal protein L22 [Pseudomonadota bacterium]|nr:50S ribosomal protein L22 [Pseudomonadota bacterium]